MNMFERRQHESACREHYRAEAARGVYPTVAQMSALGFHPRVSSRVRRELIAAGELAGAPRKLTKRSPISLESRETQREYQRDRRAELKGYHGPGTSGRRPPPPSPIPERTGPVLGRTPQEAANEARTGYRAAWRRIEGLRDWRPAKGESHA